MSSFKDNFGKNNESDALDYDDSAFYFFASTILTVVILLYTPYFVKSIFTGKSPIEKGQRVCD